MCDTLRVTAFRQLKQFNDPAHADALNRRTRLGPRDAELFPGDGLVDRFARALCANRATAFKEVLESIEFVGAVRRRVRAPVVVDLCAGHGLVGVLYALLEREVEEVVCVDIRHPESHARILAAAASVGAWAPGKVRFVEQKLQRARDAVPPGAAVVAVHACGLKTDRAIEVAIERGGPVAVMPCCHPFRAHPAPLSLKNALGARQAIDVHRTYELENAGYRVRWSAISPRVTEMNRVLAAVPRG